MSAATITSICVATATEDLSGTLMVYVVSIVGSAMLVCGVFIVFVVFVVLALKLNHTLKIASPSSPYPAAILKTVRFSTGFALAGTFAAGLRLTSCFFRSDNRDGQLIAEALKLSGSVFEVVWIYGVLYAYYGTCAPAGCRRCSRSLMSRSLL